MVATFGRARGGARQVADAAPVATKLLRLLPWTADPHAPGWANPSMGGTRLRTANAEGSGDELDGRILVVRIKHRGGANWSRTLDWDEVGMWSRTIPL